MLNFVWCSTGIFRKNIHQTQNPILLSLPTQKNGGYGYVESLSIGLHLAAGEIVLWFLDLDFCRKTVHNQEFLHLLCLNLKSELSVFNTNNIIFCGLSHEVSLVGSESEDWISSLIRSATGGWGYKMSTNQHLQSDHSLFLHWSCLAPFASFIDIASF